MKIQKAFDPPSQLSITRTFDVPVLESQRLGSMPSDDYEWNWSPSWPIHGTWTTSDTVNCYGDSCELGNVPVYRDVPVYENGKPKLQTITETLTEKSYNEKNRTIAFGGVGAAAGLGGAALAGALTGSALHPIAMVIGGVIGAAAGAAIGYKSADGDQVKEQWVTESIDHPTMTGYTHTIDPDTYYEETNCHTNAQGQRECDQELRVRGYHHRYSENISWRQVGTYDRPTLVHTNPVGPVGGGALAVLAGGVAGAGVRLLANVL